METILCGLFGSLATILGKICFSTDTWVLNSLFNLCTDTLFFSVPNCEIAMLAFRGIVFAEMLFCNALMLGYFLKALEKESSLHVTVISAGTNFMLSGLLGYIVLQEDVSNTWFFGAFLICAGICCIGYCRGDSKINKQ